MVGIVWMSTSHVQRLTLVGHAKSTYVQYKSTCVWYNSKRPTTLTKDGSTTSFVVATGPHVSINTGLGLPLITATGMVIDTIDNIVDAKYLDCPPFPINFCCATKTITEIDDDTTTHYVKFEDVHGILKKTDAFIAGVCDNFQSAKPNNVGSSEMHRPVEAMSNSNSMTTGRSIAAQWVPPPSANDIHLMIITTGDAEYL